MKKIFKGKVKYNFFIGLADNTTKFMLLCFALCVFSIVAFKFCGAPISWESIFSIDAAVLVVFSGFMVFIYLYGKYYNSLLKRWDKQGFEVLEIDDKIRIMRFDNRKIISFNDIARIDFAMCADKLPRIPKSYDVVNAQMKINLKNGEEIIYYVQTLTVLYKMLKYLRSLGLLVEAEEFDNNTLYKMQAHYWYFIVGMVVIMFIIVVIGNIAYE
ncbi:MAG: hypothetical protein IKO06_03185 [Alphaproteobacteria bacterium]|nr:hypothetical protein [Alphaproteobacteria bacterium]